MSSYFQSIAIEAARMLESSRCPLCSHVSVDVDRLATHFIYSHSEKEVGLLYDKTFAKTLKTHSKKHPHTCTVDTKLVPLEKAMPNILRILKDEQVDFVRIDYRSDRQ